MRQIKHIVVHCADTYHTMDIGIDEVRKWHVQDNGWRDVGYNLFIKRDGTVEQGRPVEQVPSCVKGYNSNAYCICYAGGKGMDGSAEDNRTIDQKKSLLAVLNTLKNTYPDAEIVGHRDLDPSKSCPSFDAKTEYRNL